MRRLLDTLNRHLDIRLGLGPRLLLLAAAVLIGVTLTQPLWNLTMFAPQYPDGLRMDIYTQQLKGDRNGQDIKEINVLNHYIGMRDLSTEDFTEFKWMPFALGILALLMLRAAVHGSMASLVDAVVLFGYFGAFSLWSFGYKLYMYGHNLAPTAPVKVPPFSPPMFGYRQIANFEGIVIPRAGTYLMLVAAVALFVALGLAWRAGTSGEGAGSRAAATSGS